MTTARPRSLLTILLAACAMFGCARSGSREDADRQVYGILEKVSERVTGSARIYPLERAEDRLRQRLPASGEAIHLSLLDSLNVAAENNREFQRQKESLYLAALTLTREQHNFEIQWSGGGSAEVSGEADDSAEVDLRDDLSSSVNTAAGGRIVAGFLNTFLRSIATGGAWDASSILDLTLTQPLLRGSGRRIVAEPLTQAERNVVYQMRAFERFRATLAVQVVSQYYGVVQQMADLESVQNNHESLRRSREQIEALFDAGRRNINDRDRASQDELRAENNVVTALNRLQTALDGLKLTLGLPVDSLIELDIAELDRLKERGVIAVDLEEEEALGLAGERRFDLRTARDRVEDAARRVLVAEDALRMTLDFSAALNVPARAGSSMNLDWSRVNWAAGFDLDLALDKLDERNAHRSALISLDAAIRAREETEDQIKAEVRRSLRDIRSTLESYRIQEAALRLAESREDSTEALYEAGRVQALDLLDAKNALLEAQLDLTDAIVSYAIARLELMRDLEGIALEPEGLRYDLELPVPVGPIDETAEGSE